MHGLSAAHGLGRCLTYSGGFIILFLLAFAGLVVTTGPVRMARTGVSARSSLGRPGRLPRH
jgi:hypothetical protein